MANEKRVADAREILLDVERIYNDNYFRSYDQTVHDIFNAFRRIVRRHATFGFVEVVHGRWVNNENDYPECDKCGYMPQYDPMIDDIWYSPYCPKCGAKMENGEKYA